MRVLLIILVYMMFCGCAQAYTLDQWADAIYKSEGGGKTRHPYGILKTYKHTTARQACKNTIMHNWRNYSKLPLKTRQTIDFTAYLAKHYAPIGASNDPGGLNINWQHNVAYWLKRV